MLRRCHMRSPPLLRLRGLVDALGAAKRLRLPRRSQRRAIRPSTPRSSRRAVDSSLNQSPIRQKTPLPVLFRLRIPSSAAKQPCIPLSDRMAREGCGLIRLNDQSARPFLTFAPWFARTRRHAMGRRAQRPACAPSRVVGCGSLSTSQPRSNCFNHPRTEIFDDDIRAIPRATAAVPDLGDR